MDSNTNSGRWFLLFVSLLCAWMSLSSQILPHHPQELCSAAYFHSRLTLWATLKGWCKHTHAHTHIHALTLECSLEQPVITLTILLSVASHKRGVVCDSTIINEWKPKTSAAISNNFDAFMHAQQRTLHSAQAFLPEQAHTPLCRGQKTLLQG